jgi:hypothetical protein
MICLGLLNIYCNEGDIFLRQTGTGEEMWIHHYTPESKCRSMTWRLPLKKEFKTQPSARKVKLTHLWDAQGSILEHYKEKGTTVNSLQYSEMLWDLLKPDIRTKLQGLLLKDIAQ